MQSQDQDPRLGQLVAGRWRLRQRLGEGGMAVVYLAEDGQGARCALKLLHTEMALRKQVRDRFLREGVVANSIAHPGAVRVLEHGTAERGEVYLAMELLEGETLGDLLKRQGAQAPPVVLDLLEQLLQVLVVAHGLGIVHRDIKPDNLFLTQDARLKVLDFGLARVLEGTGDDLRTRTGVAMGTLPFMAPEQAMGRRDEIDGRTNLFAVGATAARLLTNRKLHEAASEAELLMAMASRPAPPVATVAPQVPEPLAVVLDRALAFSREARYASAQEMLADVQAVRRGERPAIAERLRAVAEDATRLDRAAPATVPLVAVLPPGPALTPAAPPPPPVTAPRRRRWLVLTAAFALCVGAAAAVALRALDTAPEPPAAQLAAASALPAPSAVPQAPAATASASNPRDAQPGSTPDPTPTTTSASAAAHEASTQVARAKLTPEEVATRQAAAAAPRPRPAKKRPKRQRDDD